MDGENLVILVGTLGADAEVNGPATKFRMVTNETWMQDGEKKESSEWHSCVKFKSERLAPHLLKGLNVYIRGSLRTSSWEKDGVKRYQTEVVVKDLKFLDGPRKQAPNIPQPSGGFEHDDIPF